jgi:excinuclease ABC subunit C
VFSARTRPCLLHQIKRCSAPCADRISHGDYDRLVAQARAFLSGHSQTVRRELADRMEQLSQAMAYEDAAVFRDRVRALARVQARQDINSQDIEEADVVALHQAGGQACIQVFFFRSGCNFGNRAFFPAQTQDQPPEDVLAAFLAQFYEDKEPPREVLLSHELSPEDAPLLAEALAIKSGRKVVVSAPKRGDRRKLIDHAHDNAREALGRRMAESSAQHKLLDGLAQLFGLDRPPERIEIYDNSHIQGTNAVGAMVVAGIGGFLKNEYRTFNIRWDQTTPGDDYAMMREVLSRRFRRVQREDPDREHWPDLVLIDGGPGQLGVACQVFAELGIDDVAVVGISKGPDRNAGRERFYLPDRAPFSLPQNDPVLYFLQRLRDEAHRFAIGSHRVRRSKRISESPLDGIAGIGARRKKALLHQFGSARGVGEAGLVDLEAVPGISGTMAKKIYDHFHPGG